MTSLGRKIIYSLIALLLLVGIVSALVVYQIAHFDETRVTFLDVGQGDAILISEGEYQILIDGGPDGRRLQEQLGKYIPFWDRTIDIVIATHPDSDHIDGLVSVFDTYHVHEFWHANADKDTDVARALLRKAESSGTHFHTPVYGDHITLPSGAKFETIYPFMTDPLDTDDVNAMSITGLFTVAEETFFLGGDLPSEVEDRLPLGDANITVLKAGHHGSKTSTSEVFLERTNPRDIIFSAGESNRYSHPHEEVLTRSIKSGARVFRTDTEGTITYTCQNECKISFD